MTAFASIRYPERDCVNAVFSITSGKKSVKQTALLFPRFRDTSFEFGLPKIGFQSLPLRFRRRDDDGYAAQLAEMDQRHQHPRGEHLQQRFAKIGTQVHVQVLGRNGVRVPDPEDEAGLACDPGRRARFGYAGSYDAHSSGSALDRKDDVAGPEERSPLVVFEVLLS